MNPVSEKTLKSRARSRQWAIDNPDGYKARQKRWRAANSEKVRAYNAAYRKERRELLSAKRKARQIDHSAIHKRRYADPAYSEQCRQRVQRWRKENRKKADLTNQLWRAANPERARLIARTGWVNRRAKLRNAGKITPAEVSTVRAANKCAACGQPHEHMEIDHIVAISRGGRNHISNLQLLCRPCNRSKWAKDHATWAAQRFPSRYETV